jgi:ATP-dependent DNA helicase RecG
MAEKMTPDELRERILQGEDLHTDFKSGKTPDRSELAKDIVCFANTDGGRLIFGVSDDGVVGGVGDVGVLLDLVEEVAFSRCRPPVTVVPEVFALEGQNVVVLNVAKGDQRPYSTEQGRYYVRAWRRCRQASREELLRLFQATESFYYDEHPLPRTSLADLDSDEIERYVNELGQDWPIDDRARLLRNWRLTDGGHATVSGILLFGREPQVFLPSSGVVVAAFAGDDTSGDPIDVKNLRGGFFDLLEDTERFLNIYVATPHKIVGFKPERREEIPTAALREAVVNALVHRDYTIPGPVRVFALTDRVEIHTPGRPPNSVDAGAMRAGVHVTRNPHLYSRVADAGLVTRAGTGVRRMIRLVREASGRDIDIQITEAEVVIVLPRAIIG